MKVCFCTTTTTYKHPVNQVLQGNMAYPTSGFISEAGIYTANTSFRITLPIKIEYFVSCEAYTSTGCALYGSEYDVSTGAGFIGRLYPSDSPFQYKTITKDMILNAYPNAEVVFVVTSLLDSTGRDYYPNLHLTKIFGI